MGALTAASPALGQTSHAIHIAAGPLDAALITLAAQTHEQLLYTPRLVAGRSSPSVDGNLTAEQALARMVRSSDIVVNRTGPSILVLRAAAPVITAPASLQGGTTLQDPAGSRPFVAEGGEPPGGSLSVRTAHEPPPATTDVSEVDVTGTHIRGAKVASPLIVVTREDIERSGRTTVVEALRALPENFGGAAADGNETTGADRTARNPTFGTGVNLRGLGNNATLVLVNGRRIGGAGTFGDFVDLSTIPTAAVERVEVLLDGASAVYGSDAVGGVVNIILRKTYEGAETRLLAGTATHGSGAPQEGQISQTFGHRWEGGGILLSLEADRRSALNGADRSFAGNADLRPLGGSDQRITFSFPGNILIFNPATGTNSPAFAIPTGQNGVGLLPSQLLGGVINLQNQRRGFDILPRQTTQSAYIALDQAVGDRVELSADARYGIRGFRLQNATPLTQLFVTQANPFFVSPIGASSESIAYAFNDLPFPVQSGHAETISATAGGTLKLAGDWRAESYLAFGQEIDLSRVTGLVNSTNLNEALGTLPDQAGTPFSTAVNGFYNPFAGVVGANNPTVLGFIGSGSVYSRGTDRVYTASLQADGSVWSLPAGPVKLAIGGQFRRETLVRGGYNFFFGLAPTATAPVDAQRDVSAAFAELQIPLFGPDNRRPGFERLQLSVAGRIEHYEAIGSTTNPKIGLLWEPIADLRVRATYGTSFRAPALRELTDPANYGPSLFAVGLDRVRGLQLSGGNPSLKPETATSWTAGLDYTPSWAPGLTLGATGFDINYRDRIAQPVLQNLAGVLTDPTLTSFVTRITPGTNAADLALITGLLNSPAFNSIGGVFPASAYGAIVDARYVNTAALHIRGLDVTGAYHLDLGGDRLALAASATYMLTYDQQVTPTSPRVNKVGIVGFPVRFQSRVSADWTRDRLTAGAALNYTGAYKSPFGARIAANPTVDLQVRLAPAEEGLLRGITTSLNLRNVFDRAPPFYNNPNGVGYDATNGDPIGRFVFVQLTRAW
jgi:iron complex outermembrane receptor protein